MSGDTTTYPTPPCIILVCSIQSWRSSNSARSYMSIKTSPSSDRAGDGNSGGGGAQLALLRLGPKGYLFPQQAHPAVLPLAGTPGTPQQHRPKLIPADFPSYNQHQLDAEKMTLLLLSRPFFFNDSLISPINPVLHLFDSYLF